jgi:hypothetical protein
MSLVIAVIFAAISFSVAITGFTSLGEITDAQQLADAKGYAWFWVFLGSVSVAMGGASLWILKTGQQA